MFTFKHTCNFCDAESGKSLEKEIDYYITNGNEVDQESVIQLIRDMANLKRKANIYKDHHEHIHTIQNVPIFMHTVDRVALAFSFNKYDRVLGYLKIDRPENMKDKEDLEYRYSHLVIAE